MGLTVIGAVLGVLFGWGFLGYHGWGIGALVGALTGLVLQQIQKIGLLEKSVATLKDDQAKTNQQLIQLKNELRDKLSNTDTQIAKKPLAEVVKESLSVQSVSPPVTTDTTLLTTHSKEAEFTESAELELPYIDPPKVATPPPIARVIEPREPDIGDKIVAAVRRFFTEGNPIVNIGMVIMFFGVSFLVKYASSQGLFPIEFRLTGVILGAIALLVFGWKTRERPGSYGLVLQGGGIAVIYLTLFAAAKIYGLIPLGAAFGLLFVVVIFGVLLALLQNTQTLAILAAAGGFLAPILTSTGNGSHVGLFSFYLILNLGILVIALYKAWRLLNWVGFMFTFFITAAWGVLKYEPILYSSTQPFLIAFFILYLIVSILFSFKQPTNLKGMVDGSLVFGLPLVAFGLQTALLKHTEHGLAMSAIVLAVIYIALSLGLSRRYLQSHRVLIESFLALGVSFATLAVPLALDASWTSVTWALEATGLVWVGLRQARLRPRVVGYLLHAAAAISLVIVDGIDTGITPIISGDFLGVALLALTAFTIAYLLHHFTDTLRNVEKIISPIAIAFGVLWWFVAGINEMNVHVMGEHFYAAIVLFAALSAISIILVSKKLGWKSLGNSVFALMPFIYLLSLVAFTIAEHDPHPTQGFTFIALALFLLVQYRFLFIQEHSLESVPTKLIRTWHVFTAWGVFGLIFWEVSWQKEHFNLHGTAGLMIWFAALVLPVVALLGAGQKKCWPFITFERDYKNWVPAPLFLLIAIWFFAVCDKTPSHAEHYLPLVNPLDLAQFAVVLIFAYAVKRHFMDAFNFISTTVRVGALGFMCFLWLNVVTVRAIAHYQNIPYYADSLWDAAQVQMALSILWTLCALLVMNISRKIQLRELWMLGAALLAVVVLKLATKDLSGKDTLAGIISFLVVGALILLIGYLSPIPAKAKSTQDDQSNPETNEAVNE